ncbi:hypothetical protein RJI07_07450 [Mycoplasmatota bacterium WC30]
MRVYTKKILISFLAIILGITLVACGDDTTTTGTSPNDAKLPLLSNPEAIFISTDDYSVTYQDLYEEVKINDGLNQLLFMVDIDLLGEYISEITDTEIADRLKQLVFGTDDQEEIDEIDAETQAEMQKSFDDSMYLLGYTDQINDYVKLVIARENYTIEKILDAENSEEEWYIGPSTIAQYYDSQYNYDIQTIKIRFMSESDAKSVLRSFNLVSKDGELKLYTGTTPLEQVSSIGLNETNTESLTDTDLLEQFLTLYNYIYGDFRDIISTDSSIGDLLANDDLVLEYDNLLKANIAFPDFLYKTLGTYQDKVNDVDDKLYYTYEPVQYYSTNDTSYYMILNLDRTEKTDVEDFDGTKAELVALIGQEIYDEIEQTIIDTNLNTSSFVSNRVTELRQEHDFNVYDYFLGVDYQAADTEFEISEEGHETNVASYDNKTITADELLSFALGNNAPLYTIYAAQSKAVTAAHFEDVYCVDEDETCVYDMLLNESEKMTEHKDELAALEVQFNESYYASFYEFSEYLYLAYGAKDDYDMMYRHFVKATLQPFFIYDEIKTDNYDIVNYLMTLSQPYYDNYFSLDVEHVLIYMDRDEDGNPDDYEKFVDELDVDDLAAYEMKLVNFEAAIRTYLEDSDNTMTSLVGDYKKAKRDDLVWGEYKSYGFNLLTEALGELTYKTSVSAGFEESFLDALIGMYQDYLEVENENEDYLINDVFVETVYGMHLIKTEQGSEFEKPSALFMMTYDDDLEPEYLDGLVNLNDELSFEQLKIYADYRFTEISYGNGDFEDIYDLVRPDIPQSVLDAIAAYHSDLYDALYVIGYLNLIIIDELDAGTYSNEIPGYCSINESQFTERIENISDIYINQIFAEFDYTE